MIKICVMFDDKFSTFDHLSLPKLYGETCLNSKNSLR